MINNESICGVCNCRIKQNTFFADLTDKQIHAFKEVIAISFHKKREVVFMEGDECKGFYVIRTGRVKLVRSASSGKEQIIKILNAGDLLGLEGIYDADSYVNTAVVMEQTELCLVKRQDFFKIIEREPRIARKLIVALGEELEHAYERIGNLGLLTAREKMAHLLYTLANEYGVKNDGDIRLQLTLSRLEIAGLLGITQETSIRLLKSFKEEGLLEIEKRKLIIRSPEKLKKIGRVER